MANSPEVEINLGDDDWRLKNYEIAIIHYRKALRKCGGNHEASLICHLRITKCLIELERYDQAMTEVNKALALDPLCGHARMEKSRIYTALGRPKESRRELEIATSCGSTSATSSRDLRPAEEREKNRGKALWMETRAKWLGLDLAVVEKEEPFDSEKVSAIQASLYFWRNGESMARPAKHDEPCPPLPSRLSSFFNPIPLPSFLRSPDSNATAALINTIQCEKKPYPSFKKMNLTEAVSICASYWAKEDGKSGYT